MRAVYEEDELTPSHEQDREVTISSTTLLIIFFGLVLICGLFFALGYAVGRRSPQESTAATTSPLSSPSSSTDSGPKPSPAYQNGVKPHPDTIAPGPTSSAMDEPAHNRSSDISPQDPSAVTPVPKGAAVEKESSAQTEDEPATRPLPASSTEANIMVQIAAVSNPSDADVLLGALRKRGYTVAVRHEPRDPLLHVQVGPFATRAEALAMRQKLLNDGYNAFLK